VPFGELLEATRAQIARQRPARGGLFTTFLYGVLPNPSRLGKLLVPLRFYQKSGLRALVRGSRVLRVIPRLAAMEAMLPDLPRPIVLPEITPARGTRRGASVC